MSTVMPARACVSSSPSPLKILLTRSRRMTGRMGIGRHVLGRRLTVALPPPRLHADTLDEAEAVSDGGSKLRSCGRSTWRPCRRLAWAACVFPRRPIATRPARLVHCTPHWTPALPSSTPRPRTAGTPTTPVTTNGSSRPHWRHGTAIEASRARPANAALHERAGARRVETPRSSPRSAITGRTRVPRGRRSCRSRSAFDSPVANNGPSYEVPRSGDSSTGDAATASTRCRITSAFRRSLLSVHSARLEHPVGDGRADEIGELVFGDENHARVRMARRGPDSNSSGGTFPRFLRNTLVRWTIASCSSA